MKVWHRDKGKDFGRLVLAWRHRAGGRFIMKIGSWLLGAFVCGLLTAIGLHAIDQDALAQPAARIVFFVVFIVGVGSAFFRHVFYGLLYQIREKALVAVRPICGFEGLLGHSEVEKAFGSKMEYLPWEQIKDVKEDNGRLLLIIKDIREPLKIGVSPVRTLLLPEADQKIDRRNSQGGLFGGDGSLDKETMRLILQKIREIKKSAAAR